MTTNYYEMLGVRVGAHPAEIDLAYKTLSQVPNLDIEAQLELGMAHGTLLHPVRRPEYDQTLARPAQPTAQIIHFPESNHSKSVVIHRHEYQNQQSNNSLTDFASWYIMALAVTTFLGTVVLLF